MRCVIARMTETDNRFIENAHNVFFFFKFGFFILLFWSPIFAVFRIRALFHSPNLFKVIQLLLLTMMMTTISCVFCFLAFLPPLVLILVAAFNFHLFILAPFFVVVAAIAAHIHTSSKGLCNQWLFWALKKPMKFIKTKQDMRNLNDFII